MEGNRVPILHASEGRRVEVERRVLADRDVEVLGQRAREEEGRDVEESDEELHCEGRKGGQAGGSAQGRRVNEWNA